METAAVAQSCSERSDPSKNWPTRVHDVVLGSLFPGSHPPPPSTSMFLSEALGPGRDLQGYMTKEPALVAKTIVTEDSCHD